MVAVPTMVWWVVVGDGGQNHTRGKEGAGARTTRTGSGERGAAGHGGIGN